MDIKFKIRDLKYLPKEKVYDEDRNFFHYYTDELIVR